MAIGPDGQAVVPTTGPNAIAHPTAVAQLRAYLIARAQAATTPKFVDPGGPPPDNGISRGTYSGPHGVIPYALPVLPNGDYAPGGLRADPENGYARPVGQLGATSFPFPIFGAANRARERSPGQNDVPAGEKYPLDPAAAYRLLLEHIAARRGIEAQV